MEVPYSLPNTMIIFVAILDLAEDWTKVSYEYSQPITCMFDGGDTCL